MLYPRTPNVIPSYPKCYTLVPYFTLSCVSLFFRVSRLIWLFLARTVGGKRYCCLFICILLCVIYIYIYIYIYIMLFCHPISSYPGIAIPGLFYVCRVYLINIYIFINIFNLINIYLIDIYVNILGVYKRYPFYSVSWKRCSDIMVEVVWCHGRGVNTRRVDSAVGDVTLEFVTF